MASSLIFTVLLRLGRSEHCITDHGGNPLCNCSFRSASFALKFHLTAHLQRLVPVGMAILIIALWSWTDTDIKRLQVCSSYH